MKPRQRLIYYIILNICVSAIVTGTILFIYSRYYQKDCSTILTGSADGIPSTVGNMDATIAGVISAGALADEFIVIQNDGAAPVVLTGWILRNEEGSAYTFPQLTLYPGGEVHLHSKSGSDTASDLYWQRSTPAWSSGELASLYDDQNIVRAFYRVP